jgi:elongation factor Ts
MCLQIVSMDGTRWISEADVPEEAKEAELEIFRTQAADKPAEVQVKIAEGKLRKWYEEVCLLNQAYFRDEDISVEQHRAALSSEMGENIEIKRFASYTLGQE